MPEAAPGRGGLVVVDKPMGCTSHDVVARVRRVAGTRRVGHAGTLDPMATGVLVLGLERATRLLGHLTATEKAYDATIRLGVTTVTDDAEGDVLATVSAAAVADDAVANGVAALTGTIEQIPSSVSAVKVNGKRAYARVRTGEDVRLAARTVTVRSFDVRALRRTGDFVDLDVSVVCSSGTYVRALARDLGADLGVGGHVTALRRTRVGSYDLAVARTLDELETSFTVIGIDEAARSAFAVREVDAGDARIVSHGGVLPWEGTTEGPVAVFGPDGRFLALVEDRAGRAVPLAVFV
jgi:tRNA pseudouridine55 synthase